MRPLPIPGLRETTERRIPNGSQPTSYWSLPTPWCLGSSSLQWLRQQCCHRSMRRDSAREGGHRRTRRTVSLARGRVLQWPCRGKTYSVRLPSFGRERFSFGRTRTEPRFPNCLARQPMDRPRARGLRGAIPKTWVLPQLSYPAATILLRLGQRPRRGWQRWTVAGASVSCERLGRRARSSRHYPLPLP